MPNEKTRSLFVVNVDRMSVKVDTPAVPRPASTVLLVRDTDPVGIEVFLVQRSARADFASAVVFPGGVVDAADGSAGLVEYCTGLDDARASQDLSMPAGGLAYWVGGIRELFEETGFLLAYGTDGEFFQERIDLGDHRRRLGDGRLSMLELCREFGLRLATDCMHYVSFWLTPEALPRRYSTRFFVARAPEKRYGQHDGEEIVDSHWHRPEAALRAKERGELKLHPATIDNLDRIRGYDRIADALNDAHQADKSQIPRVLPIVDENGKRLGLRYALPAELEAANNP